MAPRGPSKPARAAQGEGLGSAASASAKAADSTASGRGFASTGRSRRKLPSSGMQTFSQTSQLPLPCTVKTCPGARSPGTVTVSGKSARPS
ncbi:hypothetical protein ROTAS13_04528 [Roseomonas sp. TAS13]|nr:hypothetical protein ROTAS13_04528 [Roseomonas sp. TAS13]